MFRRAANEAATLGAGSLIAALLICTIFAGAAEGETRLQDTDLLVDVGQSAADVQRAYEISTAPEPGPPLGSNTRVLRAPERGLTFWFNLDRLVIIAAERNFQGRILGLRIGDSIDQLKAKWGQPNKSFQPDRDLTYSRPEWNVAVRFWMESDGTIQRISASTP